MRHALLELRPRLRLNLLHFLQAAAGDKRAPRLCVVGQHLGELVHYVPANAKRHTPRETNRRITQNCRFFSLQNIPRGIPQHGLQRVEHDALGNDALERSCRRWRYASPASNTHTFCAIKNSIITAQALINSRMTALTLALCLQVLAALVVEVPAAARELQNRKSALKPRGGHRTQPASSQTRSARRAPWRDPGCDGRFDPATTLQRT